MAMHVSFDSRTDTLQLQLRSRGGSMAKPSNLQMEVDRSAAEFFGGTMGLMSWTRFRPHSRRHVVPIIRGCVIKGDEAFKMRCYEHDLMSIHGATIVCRFGLDESRISHHQPHA